MSPYILGHMMLGVTVAATRNDLLSAESWQGQPGPMVNAKVPVGVTLHGWRIHFSRDHKTTR